MQLPTASASYYGHYSYDDKYGGSYYSDDSALSPSPAPTISAAPTVVCFDYTLYLSDSYGDGWNGIYLHIDGSSYTISSDGYSDHYDDAYSAATYTVCLAPGATYYPYTCDGEYGSEASWYIDDPDGSTVASGSGIDCANDDDVF